MHIDYAKELVERVENDPFLKGDQQYILKTVATEREILALIDQVGDEKHQSIAATVREIKSAVLRYRTVTNKQKTAIVLFLLAKFGTARAVLAAAFATTEREMFS